jgi:hypothetical protein
MSAKTQHWESLQVCFYSRFRESFPDKLVFDGTTCLLNRYVAAVLYNEFGFETVFKFQSFKIFISLPVPWVQGILNQGLEIASHIGYRWMPQQSIHRRADLRCCRRALSSF